MVDLSSYSTNYQGLGQQLQHFLASSTFFWLITIAIVFFICAVMISGFKKVATPNRLKWLLLHTLSLFLIGYFILPIGFNKFVNVIIFSFFVTLLSTAYRYIILHTKFDWKNRSLWFFVNLFTLFVVQIIYEVLKVTDLLLQLLFTAFCLTIVGASVHFSHKDEPTRNPPMRPRRPWRRNRRHR
jgi:hypothetical protein